MDDEPSSSSSASSTTSESAELMYQNENSPRRYAHTSGKNVRITINPAGSGEVGVRRPFRQVGGGPSSSASSFSSAEINVRKKSALHKQKNVGGRRIKCVLVGDSKIGKTALVRSFLGQSSPDYVPTTEDVHVYEGKGNSYGESRQENGKKEEVALQICDTGGQEEMDRLRPLCYTRAQMVIICFSVMSPASFANVTMKWLPEVKRHCMVTEDPENPLKLLLVGTQSDLRSNVSMLLKLMDDGLAPVSETQALRLANKIGAMKYVETSALTSSNVNQIFDLALTYGEAKVVPKLPIGLEMDTGLQGKILPNITERKLLFWRRWRVPQNKSSNKMKRLVLLPCLF